MVRFLRFVDRYVGAFIVFLLWPITVFITNKKRPAKKVLIIKLWAIGDSVLTLALIKGIKKTTKATVHVLTTEKVDTVYKHPLIDKLVYPKDLFSLFSAYDIAIDCEPYLNTSAILAFLTGKRRVGFSDQWRSRLYTDTVKFRKDQHMVQNYLDMLRATGKKYDTDSLEPLSYQKEDKEKVDVFLNGKKQLIGITPGVAESAKSRMWYEDRFAELADRLIKELGATVVFVDSKGNRPVVKNIMGLMNEKAIDASGEFSLKETFCLIEKCKIFISNDTGPMHIAAAQGVKTIGLFGPNTPVLWGPYGKGNISIYKTKLKPSIQNDKGIFPEGDRDGFMDPISVAEVFNAAKSIWKDLK
ncbi:MAG: glycosyltransferase family 9 protein [Nanoarchaeota archaeon]|nr:glycosyltransferase family 9 protein [Nanoarchaeota archaeon]